MILKNLFLKLKRLLLLVRLRQIHTIKIKKVFFMVEVLIHYQDSVIAFALKYKINNHFIVKSKDYSFEIALLCFYYAPVFYFMLLPCRIYFLFLSLSFSPCIMLLL